MAAKGKTIELPVYDIPDRNGPNQTAYFEGLFILNALFRAYGTIDATANQAAMSTTEVVDALTMALALHISNDDRVQTPRDARLASEAIEKRMKSLIKSLMESEAGKALVAGPKLKNVRPN